MNTLLCRGRAGSPEAIRGRVAAMPYAEGLSPPPGPLARADLPSRGWNPRSLLAMGRADIGTMTHPGA
jgi:hypothetical protein